jgi:hypothetical protein
MAVGRRHSPGRRIHRPLALLAAVAVLQIGCATQDGPGRRAEPPSPARSHSAPASKSPTSEPTPSLAPDQTANGRSREFTVAASGDVLVHDGVRIQAGQDADTGGPNQFDFLPMLADTTPLIRGSDLALCHLEVPLAPSDGPYHGYPRFSAPQQVADALATQGYDSCSTASNHSLDQGSKGITRTLNALDTVDIRHPGTARTAAEAAIPTVLDVRGVKVAHLSYTFGFNGLRPSSRWLANRIDTRRILSHAARATRAGADVTIVSLHWGTEYEHEPTPWQRTLARQLLASPDIDLLVGHHAHVVQPLEKIGNKWVAYGLGNLIAAKTHNFAGGATREGIIARFRFREQPDGSLLATAVQVTPTYIDATSSLRLIDTANAATEQRGNVDLSRIREARQRTTRFVLSRAAAADGLRIR